MAPPTARSTVAALLAAAAFAHDAPALPRNDQLVVSGFATNAVVRYDAVTGAPLDQLGAGVMQGVLGVTVGPDSLIYACSETTNEVLRFDPTSGALVDVFIGDDASTPQDETGGLAGPSGIVFGPDCAAYVASFNDDAVRRYEGRSGAFLDVFVPSGTGNLDGPDAGLAFGPDGDLFVPSFFNHRIKRYDGATGAFEGNYVGPSHGAIFRPRSILFPGDGFAYVASEGSDRVLRVDEALGGAGGVVELVVDDLATPNDETGGLDGPTGLAVDASGRLYVGSIQTSSVLRYDVATGAFLDEFVPSGGGGLALPTALLLRPESAAFCVAAPNSIGDGCLLGARGSSSVAANALGLVARCAPRGRLGVFSYGTASSAAALGDGFRCLAGPIFRLPPVRTDTWARAVHALDLTAPPAPGGQILAGSIWSFQFWYRDPHGPGGSGSNLSNGLSVEFSP